MRLSGVSLLLVRGYRKSPEIDNKRDKLLKRRELRREYQRFRHGSCFIVGAMENQEGALTV